MINSKLKQHYEQIRSGNRLRMTAINRIMEKRDVVDKEKEKRS